MCVLHRDPCLSLCLLLVLAGASAAQTSRQKPSNRPEVVLPALRRAKPLKADPRDDEIQRLLKERYNEAVGEIKGIYEKFLAGTGGIDLLFDAGQRLTKAGMEQSDNRADKAALLIRYVELTREVEKMCQ